MKNKLTVVVAFACFLAAASVRVEEVTVIVKGMVCSFCAQGIKKTFGKNENVTAVDVDLDKKVVRVTIKPNGKLSDEEIKQTIIDSGFDVVTIERGQHA